MPKRKISEIDSSVGRNLVFYRKLCGLTQQQVADLLAVNRTTYTKYETCSTEPSLEILKRIAEIFDIQPALLLQEVTGAPIGDVTSNAEDDLVTSEERLIIRRYRTLDRDSRERVVALLFDLSPK